MVKICDVCGRRFVPNSNSQKRCSQECRIEARRKNDRERYYRDIDERRRHNREYYRDHPEYFENYRNEHKEFYRDYHREYYQKSKQGEKPEEPEMPEMLMECGNSVEECLNCDRPGGCVYESDM